MSNPYDESFKKLVEASPKEFAQWLIPGAKFINALSNELIGDKLIADSVLEIVVNGQRMIQHIEFQTGNDREMADRVLWYNVRIGKLHKLPVRSFIIYLYTDGQIPSSPLVKRVPAEMGDDNDIVHVFFFVNIELSRLSPEAILQSGQLGLLPLLPCTKGGTSREMITTMFSRLRDQTQSHDLATIGYALAGLVMKRKNNDDLDWLKELFESMEFGILRESPIYQMILQKGEEQGIKKGEKQGEEQGVQALQKATLKVVENRFPRLVPQAEQYIAALHDLTLLEQLNAHMWSVSTEQEARALLATPAQGGKGNIGQA